MGMVYLAPPAFFLIALVLSMLGMGGSQLYLPILHRLGMDFKTKAVPLGMLLNVVNNSSATLAYARKKLINSIAGLPFGVSIVLLAPLGTLVNIAAAAKPVILVFALFTATAAALMLSGWKPKGGDLSARQRVVLGAVAGAMGCSGCRGLTGVAGPGVVRDAAVRRRVLRTGRRGYSDVIRMKG